MCIINTIVRYVNHQSSDFITLKVLKYALFDDLKILTFYD